MPVEVTVGLDLACPAKSVRRRRWAAVSCRPGWRVDRLEPLEGPWRPLAWPWRRFRPFPHLIPGPRWLGALEMLDVLIIDNQAGLGPDLLMPGPH